MPCKISLDWVYRGMRTLIMENEFLKVVVLLDKGSDIMELRYKPKDLNLLLETEEGHRNPLRLIPLAPFEHGMEDLFGGGWNECLPNTGSPCIYKGIPHMLHGEVPLSPFDCSIEEESKEVVKARLSLNLIRYPMRLIKWIELKEGERSLRIKESLINLSGEELDFSWLHHPNFGEPFLEPDCKITIKGGKVITPSKSVSKISRLKEGIETDWPYSKLKNGKEVDLSLIPSKDVKALDVCFISNLIEPWYSLYNPNLKLGIAIRWDKDVFRYIWFWQNFWGSGYPWYGRLWNIGLEFCTSYGFGLDEQSKNGSIVKLKENSMIETNIIATIYEDIEEVKEVSKEGKVR
jgi:hypothetical protein